MRRASPSLGILLACCVALLAAIAVFLIRGGTTPSPSTQPLQPPPQSSPAGLAPDMVGADTPAGSRASHRTQSSSPAEAALGYTLIRVSCKDFDDGRVYIRWEHCDARSDGCEEAIDSAPMPPPGTTADVKLPVTATRAIVYGCANAHFTDTVVLEALRFPLGKPAPDTDALTYDVTLVGSRMPRVIQGSISVDGRLGVPSHFKIRLEQKSASTHFSTEGLIDYEHFLYAVPVASDPIALYAYSPEILPAVVFLDREFRPTVDVRCISGNELEATLHTSDSSPVGGHRIRASFDLPVGVYEGAMHSYPFTQEASSSADGVALLRGLPAGVPLELYIHSAGDWQHTSSYVHSGSPRRARLLLTLPSHGSRGGLLWGNPPPLSFTSPGHRPRIKMIDKSGSRFIDVAGSRWSVAVSPGDYELALYQGGGRVSLVEQVTVHPGDNLGPIAFRPLASIPIDVAVDCDTPGRLIVEVRDSYGLLEQYSEDSVSAGAVVSILVPGPCRLVMSLAQPGLTITKTADVDPVISRVLHFIACDAAGVAVQMHFMNQGRHLPGHSTCTLVSTDGDRFLVSLKDGIAQSPMSLVPNRPYYYRVASNNQAMICGVLTPLETGTIMLDWAGAPTTVADMKAAVGEYGMLLEQYDGLDLTFVPEHLRFVSLALPMQSELLLEQAPRALWRGVSLPAN